MMELTVKTNNALKAYNKATATEKALLENLFGKDVFSLTITDRIKTFEDAIEFTGRPDVPDFSGLPEDMRKHFVALYKMEVITEALNEGWKPDWNNDDEYKYYPYFVMSSSSFAFCGSFCDDAIADAGSGSRLVLRSRELAVYSAKQFVEIWRDIQLG